MAKYCNMPAYIINSINWINLLAEPKQQAQSAYNKWTWQPPPAKWYTWHSVNHYHFKSELCSVQTQNYNLGDSVPYLNPVVTPETCVYSVYAKLNILHKIKHAMW